MTPVASISTTLTPAELDRARFCLTETHNGFAGAIRNLSNAQWTFKPASDRWSIAEIAEHILFVQDRVLGPVREKLAAAPRAETSPAQVDDFVLFRFADRQTKVTAPPPLNPAGGLALSGALERAESNRTRFQQFLESTPDLRDHAIESLPLQILSGGKFTMLDGYQWILAAIAHTERHTKQILEVIADRRFPAN